MFDSRCDLTDNGATLDPSSLAIISPSTSVYDVAQHRILFTPYLDYQPGKNNTASIRYRITQSDIPHSGLEEFNLVENADHAHSLAQTAQIVDTDVLNENAVNETLFQFFSVSSSTVALNSGASILS